MIFYTKQIIFLAATLCLLLSPTNGQEVVVKANLPAKGVQGYEFIFPALGTLVQLKAFSADQALVQQAFNEAEQNARRIESILTDYDSESETRRLTTAAFAKPTPVSEDLWRVLNASASWHSRTNGAFDSSLGSLTRLWRKYRRSQSVPTGGQIEAALSATGWQYVRLEPSGRTVELTREGIQFDFGAIGKGYIVDRIFEGLAKNSVACCLVNISGNMRCGTAPPEREGWRIAISPLEKEGEPLREISIVDSAIATSGDLWQFIEMDGVRRSHILDPHTGLGVPGPIAATAIAATATDADALATAACVIGGAEAIELTQQLGDYELLIATQRDDHSVEILETKLFPK